MHLTVGHACPKALPMNHPSISRRTLLKSTAAVSAAVPAAVTAAPSASAATTKRIAIIGSGYGGAVAARQLTAAGYTVDMIEMGADWDAMGPDPATGKTFTSMTSATSRSQWFMTRTDMPFSQIAGFDVVNKDIKEGAGVLGIEYFPGIKVYVGRGVGGGSLVNGGMAVTPRKSYFQKVLPQINADEMFNVYFPRANAELGVKLPASDVIMNTMWYQYMRVATKHAANAGYSVAQVPNVYDWDYMRNEVYLRVPRSALAQEVVFGNNYGKKSLPRTILKVARATGKVNLIPFTEVTSITANADATFTLALKTINFDGVIQSQRNAVYDRVVMAAGSVGTNRLLMKAKAEGTISTLPAETGKKWGPNGNVMLARHLAFKADGSNYTGMYQSTIPAMGVLAWDDTPASVFAEIAPFPTGVENRTNVYLAITDNPNLGEYGWDATASKLTLNWDSAKAAPSVAAVKNVFDKINTANPGSSYRSDLFESGKTFADYFSYHPLGGMIIGEATDLNGEVKGVPGLFVLDGSLIPGKIGVNPFVTITALAERCMDKLLAAGRFA